jgi:hypothetical protein
MESDALRKKLRRERERERERENEDKALCTAGIAFSDATNANEKGENERRPSLDLRCVGPSSNAQFERAAIIHRRKVRKVKFVEADASQNPMDPVLPARLVGWERKEQIARSLPDTVCTVQSRFTVLSQPTEKHCVRDT